MTHVMIEPNSEIESNWAMMSHLVGLVPVLFVNVLIPLVIWFIKKDNSSFIEMHSKESVNFQVTVLIGYLISIWLCSILIGYFLIAVIFIGNIILVFTAAFKAKKSASFQYPCSLRFF